MSGAMLVPCPDEGRCGHQSHRSGSLALTNCQWHANKRKQAASTNTRMPYLRRPAIASGKVASVPPVHREEMGHGRVLEVRPAVALGVEPDAISDFWRHKATTVTGMRAEDYMDRTDSEPQAEVFDPQGINVVIMDSDYTGPHSGKAMVGITSGPRCYDGLRWNTDVTPIPYSEKVSSHQFSRCIHGDRAGGMMILVPKERVDEAVALAVEAFNNEDWDRLPSHKAFTVDQKPYLRYMASDIGLTSDGPAMALERFGLADAHDIPEEARELMEFRGMADRLYGDVWSATPPRFRGARHSRRFNVNTFDVPDHPGYRTLDGDFGDFRDGGDRVRVFPANFDVDAVPGARIVEGPQELPWYQKPGSVGRMRGVVFPEESEQQAVAEYVRAMNSATPADFER